MRYDEDDLYEYSDGSFDEGEAIDEVIDTLKPDISVTEAQAEAELDKVDWDIDAAVANLRKRYAKPKQAPQKPASSASDAKATAKSASSAFNKPSPDDVVLKAQEGAFTKPGAQKSAGTNSGANSAGPTSKQNSPAPTSTPAPKPKVAAVNKDSLISRISGLSLKHSCSFVVIGHVDAGKSTLMGRLLHDTGALSAKTVQKFEHESNKAGKSSFWLAWALDSTDEERSRGVTVDIGEASFETADTRFTVLDAPGHKDYVPNMIAGVAQADLAVLVVDADTNAFESGFSLDGQTKEHAVLARSLGLERVIVAVNKLDTQNWSEDRFEDIKVQMNEFLTKKVGYNLDQLFYVPTSGIAGVNIVKTGQEKACSWYTGPSLVGSLENFVHSRTTKDAVKQPLRFLVSNSFVEPFQSNLTLTGRVLTGCLEAGDPVEIVGLKETAKVKSMDREFLVAGEPGEIKLALDNLKLDDGPVNVRPGDVVAGAGANLKPVTKFIAKIRLFDIPRPILPGTKLSFHLGRVDDMVTVTKIIESLATSTKKSAAPARKLRHLGKGAAARVELELASPAILSTTDVCKDLGRFVLRLNGSTVGGGVVESIENV